MEQNNLITNQPKEKEPELFIGQMIQQTLKEQERTVTWLARKLNCDRTNIYDIFKRRSIDTELLVRLCLILNTNFFAQMAERVEEKIAEFSVRKPLNFDF